MSDLLLFLPFSVRRHNLALPTNQKTKIRSDFGGFLWTSNYPQVKTQTQKYSLYNILWVWESQGGAPFVSWVVLVSGKKGPVLVDKIWGDSIPIVQYLVSVFSGQLNFPQQPMLIGMKKKWIRFIMRSLLLHYICPPFLLTCPLRHWTRSKSSSASAIIS